MVLKAFVIFVRDVDTSRTFYQQALGQVVTADHGENVVFTSGLSIWEAEHARGIIFGEKRKNAALPGAENLEIYFETDDLDNALDKLKESGAVIIQPVHEEPWGQLTFRCADPDGHVVEIAEPITSSIRRLSGGGYSPEQIVERTSMPMELVLQTIGWPRFC